ncbi:prepilin peptidase [Haloimpatiens sp. FM7315]|uniref:prepilin peptidase n=1 Tax=Haloimpatiens sp. FM7315 TaxID=3298609 RepID=UPI003977B9AA
MLYIIFFLGLIIGSFLNVCIYRIPREESIVVPHSHCIKCNHKIKFYDLIPLISYAFLKGKCRNCKEKISLIYPLVEVITAISWTLIYKNYGYSVYFFKYIFLIDLMIVISFIDYKFQEVYFSTFLIGLIGGSIFIILEMVTYNNFPYIFKNYLLGGVVLAVLLSIIIILTKGMGWGDAEIVFLVGFFLGLKKSILLLFLSFIIGGIYGVIALRLKRKNLKDFLAFVPFIAISTFISIIWGDNIIKLYLNYII